MNQIVSVTGSTTGFFSDAVNVDYINVGDFYSVKTDFASMTIVGISASFLANTNTVTKYQMGNVHATTNSVTRYVPLSGLTSGLTNLTDAQNKFKITGTAKNLSIYVKNTTRTTATTVGLNKNGASGNLLVSVPALSSGLYKDIVNTDSVASGDLLCVYTITGAS